MGLRARRGSPGSRSRRRRGPRSPGEWASGLHRRIVRCGASCPPRQRQSPAPSFAPGSASTPTSAWVPTLVTPRRPWPGRSRRSGASRASGSGACRGCTSRRPGAWRTSPTSATPSWRSTTSCRPTDQPRRRRSRSWPTSSRSSARPAVARAGAGDRASSTSTCSSSGGIGSGSSARPTARSIEADHGSGQGRPAAGGPASRRRGAAVRAGAAGRRRAAARPARLVDDRRDVGAARSRRPSPPDAVRVVGYAGTTGAVAGSRPPGSRAAAPPSAGPGQAATDYCETTRNPMWASW